MKQRIYLVGRHINLPRLSTKVGKQNTKILTVSLVLIKSGIGGLNQPFYWRKTAAMMRGYTIFCQCLLMLAGTIAIILAPPVCWPFYIEGLHNQITTVFGDD